MLQIVVIGSFLFLSLTAARVVPALSSTLFVEMRLSR